MAWPRTIVVVGAGVVGSSAALALARALSPGTRIVVTPPTDQASDVGPGTPVLAASPFIRNFHAELGIDEAELVRSGIASYSLGTADLGWTGDDTRPTFVPYGDIGVALGGVPFHQLLSRLSAAGVRLRSSDFSVAALMAQAGRFAHPSDDPTSPLSSLTYGLHLHRDEYASRLRILAERAGAEFIRSPIADVSESAIGVEHVRLADRSTVTGELFIDASGAAAHLAAKLGNQWATSSGGDRVIAWQRADSPPPAPYALQTAHPACWQVTVPGMRGVGELLAFSSHHLGEDEALAIAARLGAGGDVEVLETTCGRRPHPWSGNVVALGSAAAIVAPLGSTALDLAQQQIRRLLRLLPATQAMDAERAEFNRETGNRIDRALDYQQLRFALNGRTKDSFWNEARAWPLSSALQYKIDLFRSRGRAPLMDGDDATEGEWAVTFEALGLMPHRHEALAEAFPVATLQERLERLRELMLRAIAPLPRHGQYLAHLSGRAAA